jgi:DNA-binding HxlR family transcriptional regulator
MVPTGPLSRARRESADAGATSVASMVESVVGCKWSVRLLRLLADGHTRPSELLRSSPGLSAKVMNERLRKMTRFGIVRRTVFGEKPPIEVEYRLTSFGEGFIRILEEVRRLQADVDRGAFAAGGAVRDQR